MNTLVWRILAGVRLKNGETQNKNGKSVRVSHEIPLWYEKFIENVKREKPDFDVWCYTGYTLEQLEARNDEATNETLKNIDVLVDGRFVEERKNPEIKFRGSDNQRLLDVQSCLRQNKIVEINI